jgi:anti-sigma regulatory factor (Ser/Thr protein kinase)
MMSSDSVVTLTIPASVEHVQLARLVAAGLADRLGWDIDTIEDLRIGVDELCVAVIEAGVDDAELRLEYRADDDRVRITGACVSARPDPPQLSELSRQIVAAVATDWDLGNEDGSGTFSLVKSR